MTGVSSAGDKEYTAYFKRPFPISRSSLPRIPVCRRRLGFAVFSFPPGLAEAPRENRSAKRRRD